jgi:hypothetical protein
MAVGVGFFDQLRRRSGEGQKSTSTRAVKREAEEDWGR